MRPAELICEQLRSIAPTIPGCTALILYGSAARNEMSADSDIDVLVVFSRVPAEEDRMLVKRAIESFWSGPLDLLLTSSQEVEKHYALENESDENCGIVETAIKTGLLLWPV